MANPAFNEKTLQKFGYQEDVNDVMTVSGAINKVGLLFVLLVMGAAYGWTSAASGGGGLIITVSFVLALILSMTIIFKKEWAPQLAPVYALSEGVVLGAISAIASASMPGVASNAIALTLGDLGLMLILYRFQILRATPAFQKAVIISTGAIALVYVLDLVMGIFGHGVPMIHESGRVGILFSLFAVGVASMNFILDFDLIEQAAARRAPKYVEWYSAFALMLTLVWLYLEILRLLGKTSRK